MASTADWNALDEHEKRYEARRMEVYAGMAETMDQQIGRFIERHNRAGVPLYLWYPKGTAEPQVLPQLLTQGMLTGLTGGK